MNKTLGKKIFILILLGGAIVRFLTVGKFMSFTPDEEYQAYITQTLIKNFHIIWIGLSNGSFGLFLGPYWQYILYPFLAIFRGDPIAMGYLATIFGVATIPLLYFLGKQMFGQKVGIIASLLYSFSAMAIYYDQKPYPSGISFLSVLMALSLYMTKSSKKWWVVFAFAYGMVFHTHLSLLPVIFIAIYWALTHKKQIDKQSIAISAFTLLLMVAPLIAFDYFHKGSNISAPFKVFFASDRPHFGSTIPYHLTALINSFGRFFYLTPSSNTTDEVLWPCVNTPTSTHTIPPLILSVISFLIFIYFLIKKDIWENDGKRLLALMGLSLVIPFTIFSAVNPIEYYLIGFYPLFYLIIASMVEELKGKKKLLGYFVIGAIVLMNLYTVITAKTDYGLRVKKNMVIKVMNIIQDQPFELEEAGDCHKYEGWRYLFSVYGRRPVKSSEDVNFGWLYPDELTNQTPHYRIVINETKIPINFQTSYDYSIQEGGFTTYIYIK